MSSRLNRASTIVLSWSPWWVSYLGKVDISLKGATGSRLTGYSSMVIAADPDFVSSSDISELAVALEFALQQSVKGMDIRAIKSASHNPHTSSTLIALAQSLEINSDINDKLSRISPPEWERMLSRSLDSKHWGEIDLNSLPSLPPGSWVPSDFGFDDGLTAESYLEKLKKLSLEKEQEFYDNQENEPQEDEEGKGSENPEYSGDEKGDNTPDEKSSSESDSAIQQHQNSDCEGSENQQDESSQTSTTEDSGNSHNSSESSNDEEGVSSENEPAPDGHNGDDSDNQPQKASEPGNDTNSNNPGLSASTGHIEPENDTSEHSPSETSNDVGDSADSSLGDVVSEDNDSNKDYESLEQIVKKEANEVAQHQLIIPTYPPEDDDVVKKSQGQREDALSAMAKEIVEYDNQSNRTSPGAAVGNGFSQWAYEKTRKSATPWSKILKNILAPVISKAQMSGKTDMSFAKRHPNQLRDGPILMGYVSYAPDVTILVDSSPSMIRDAHKVIREFSSVMQKLFITYSQPVCVALADSGVKYAFESMTPAPRVMKNITKTYHGSSYSFGDTIESILKKGVSYRGKKYNKPDILIVLTDCLFSWPFPDKKALSRKYGTIVIVSTLPYEDVQDRLPAWVKNRKNFVFAN